MKLKFFLVIFLSIGLVENIHAQNLVPNPSFEDYYSCPSISGQVDSVVDWFAVTESPDYFNICATNAVVSVPSNFLGYQNAHTGDAYCGLICYWPTANGREYIGTQLTNALIPNQKYFISFWLSLSGSTSVATTLGSNKFGCKLSTQPFTYNSLQPNNQAIYYSDSIVTDTSNWVRISGSFVADSSYQYISFGNFFDDSYTDTAGLGTNTQHSYYYIDDVCLSTDSVGCTIHDGLEIISQPSISVNPNPSYGYFLLSADKPMTALKINNSLGQIVFATNQTDKRLKVETHLWPKGIYFLTVQIGTQFFFDKLLIQ